eukprot:403354413
MGHKNNNRNKPEKGGKNKNKNKKESEHIARQQEKREEKKTKRELKREKNKFNKAKHESNMSKFRLQLVQYGLKVKEMGGDGNCLFRSIADQLEGNEKLHRKYRQEAIEYIEANKEMYAPFIEDDETIDQYLGDMAKDGTWGGQMELQVLSLIYKFNYIVHQVDNPIMAFSNFDWGAVPTLHISYHLGEHYNSVRLLEDNGDGPVMPIGHELQIKNPIQENGSSNGKLIEEEKKQPESLTMNELCQYALQQIGVTDAEIMEKAIIQCFGQDISNLDYGSISSTYKALSDAYEDIEINLISQGLEKNVSLKDDPDEMTYEEKIKKLSKDDFILGDGDKIIEMPAKNKNCPCNSRKKYKNCCYITDIQRKTEFIEAKSKLVQENAANKKGKGILML